MDGLNPRGRRAANIGNLHQEVVMNSEIVESFSQMVREKGIDKDILAGIVEDVFSMMVRKKYGQEAKFDQRL